MKAFLFLFTCFCVIYSPLLPAQQVEELRGEIIGTKECVDYDTGNMSLTLNTAENLFDDDLNTYFATYQRSGGWAGLDLGEEHVITKVAYCPADLRERLVLGVFEGANHPDFGDAIPILVVRDVPASAKLTEQEVFCSRGFRYVRYVGPDDARCKLSELKFYGYKSKGSDSKLYQVTNLPTVSIHTEDARDILSKENYLKGIVSIISENGTQIFSDSLEIRGRGNASWQFPKKPYRMKLYKKNYLLDFPAKAKNWTLINNYGDKTLMRNLLAFDLSERLEMPYTPAGRAVDVLVNGEYKGTYQLCDHMEAGPDRVDIRTMEPTDTLGHRLTGGYFIEIDSYASQEPSHAWFNSSYMRMPVTIKHPKNGDIVPQQKAYIRSFFESMEQRILSSDYKDPVNGFRKYLDMETFILRVIIQELSGNPDAYWSIFMYKNYQESMFYFSPVWDFDIAYENDRLIYPTNNSKDWLHDGKGRVASDGTRTFIKRIFSDQNFYSDLQKTYYSLRDRGIIAEEPLLNVVDEYAEELDESQTLNFKRWNILNRTVHENPKTYGSYQGEVENIKNYIKNRIVWMDNKLGYDPLAGGTDLPVIITGDKNLLSFSGLSGPVFIRICDVIGKLIHTANIVEESYSLFLEKGLYVVQVTDLKGKQATRKIYVP